jgi:hypothetical protein
MDQVRFGKFLEHYDSRPQGALSTEETVVFSRTRKGSVMDSLEVNFNGGLGTNQENWLSFQEIVERLRLAHAKRG